MRKLIIDKPLLDRNLIVSLPFPLTVHVVAYFAESTSSRVQLEWMNANTWTFGYMSDPRLSWRGFTWSPFSFLHQSVHYLLTSVSYIGLRMAYPKNDPLAKVINGIMGASQTTFNPSSEAMWQQDIASDYVAKKPQYLCGSWRSSVATFALSKHFTAMSRPTGNLKIYTWIRMVGNSSFGSITSWRS